MRIEGICIRCKTEGWVDALTQLCRTCETNAESYGKGKRWGPKERS